MVIYYILLQKFDKIYFKFEKKKSFNIYFF